MAVQSSAPSLSTAYSSVSPIAGGRAADGSPTRASGTPSTPSPICSCSTSSRRRSRARRDRGSTWDTSTQTSSDQAGPPGRSKTPSDGAVAPSHRHPEERGHDEERDDSREECAAPASGYGAARSGNNHALRRVGQGRGQGRRRPAGWLVGSTAASLRCPAPAGTGSHDGGDSPSVSIAHMGSTSREAGPVADCVSASPPRRHQAAGRAPGDELGRLGGQRRHPDGGPTILDDSPVWTGDPLLDPFDDTWPPGVAGGRGVPLLGRVGPGSSRRGATSTRPSLELPRVPVRRLRAAGIAPVATLHHFSEPAWFSDRRRLREPRGRSGVVRFVGLVADRLGDLVDEWVTDQRAGGLVVQGGSGMWPPRRPTSLGRPGPGTLLLAHARAYRRSTRRGGPARSPCSVGIAHHQVVFRL